MMVPVPQIPYAAIGIGVALLFGLWSFLVAETARERAVILIAPMAALAVPYIAPSRAGRVVSLVLWMAYGIGCIIYLRLNGVGVR
jgi:hypothetical protein